MTKYYVSADGNQSGPHTIKEIKAMAFTDDHLIWYEQLPNWFSAKDFVKAKKNTIENPPPLPNLKFDESRALKKALVESAIPFGILLIAAFICCGGFYSDYELEQFYPTINLRGAEIRSITSALAIVFAMVPSLFIFIVNYRMRMMREVKRLRMGSFNDKIPMREIARTILRLRNQN